MSFETDLAEASATVEQILVDFDGATGRPRAIEATEAILAGVVAALCRFQGPARTADRLRRLAGAIDG